MQVSKINGSSTYHNSTNFKSAVPVFVHVCADGKEIAPAIGEELNKKFMLKIDHMLNKSLKRGVNSERDGYADRLVRFFSSRVRDYRDRVLAFTCVDGGFESGVLKPYFYLTTGETQNKLLALRKQHKDAVKMSQGYKTANLQIAKDDYYQKGKRAVVEAFSKFHPFGGEPQALFAYFKPLRKKNGEIKDYVLYNAEFKGVNDVKNPSITLDKIS